MPKHRFLKQLAVLFITVTLVLSSAGSVSARSCVDEFQLNFASGSEIPPNVGSQIKTLDFTVTGFAPTTEGVTYRLVLNYFGLQKTIQEFSIGSSDTSKKFTIDYTQIPEAFYLRPDVYKSEKQLEIVKVSADGSTKKCQLWDYEAFSSPVNQTETSCGDTFSYTRNKRGAEGGCVDKYYCNTAVGEGWWCECDQTCKDQGGQIPNPVPSDPVNPSQPTNPDNPTNPTTPVKERDPNSTVSVEEDGNIFQAPTSAQFDSLNPLKNNAKLKSPGGIISRILVFAFPLAGLILFTMLVWGGFEMLVGATGKGIDAGKQRITNAVIGFFALFVSYWVFQIVEVIFGLQIL